MTVQVLFDGQPINGLLKASISSNNYFSCDSFSFTLASGQGALRHLRDIEAQAYALVELRAGVAGADESHRIAYGRMDRVTSDPILGLFGAECRDLSAALIDSHLQQVFVNQTASEVVMTIAVQHGLLPIVAPTLDMIGRYYEDGYTRLSLGEYSRYRSSWDLVVSLARQESFDVYVDGATLYFGPSLTAVAEPVEIRPSDVMAMRFERRPALADSLAVDVQTWDSQQTTAYKGGASGLAEGGLSSGTTSFLFSQPNLSAVQADAMAAMYALELGRLSTTVRLEMPWDLRLNPRGSITLLETGTSYDGLYAIDCVERVYSSVSGSVQFVTAAAISV
jgi:hypothetical protein